MNPTPALRCLMLACCGLVLTAVSGCSRWIEMANHPMESDDNTAQTIARDEPHLGDRLAVGLRTLTPPT